MAALIKIEGGWLLRKALRQLLRRYFLGYFFIKVPGVI